MILLTSTSDKLQCVVAAATAVTVDTYCAFADASGSPVTIALGRLNNHFTTAAGGTIDLAGSPATSTSRNIKQLKISNNNATYSVTVTIQHTDGSTVVPIEQVVLAPGERVGYEEGVGIRVFDAVGREKSQGAQTYPGNSNTSDVTCSSADTYLTGSSLLIANRLQVGCGFKWRFRATKTAAGVATATFNIRTGTAGAVGDTSRCLHTFSAIQTAATDTGWFDLEANFEAIGSSAVLQSIARMDHTAADAAGMGTLRYNQVKSSAFDVTPAGTIIGVSCNPGASGVWTVQFVSVEAYGLLV